MENHLLQENSIWNIYTGQNLIIKDFVHLFKIDVSLNYPKIKPENILSSNEISKSILFLKRQDRENYIVRRYFLRLILSQILQLPPAEIEFSMVANKKPFLEAVHFNTSHTNNLAVIAISSSPLGVDIESINPDFNFEDIMDTSFNEEESLFVKQSIDPALSFYALWTRKEALLKATGEGLVDQMHLVPSMGDNLPRAKQNFKLYSFRTLEGTVISTAFSPEIKQTMLWLGTSAPISF